MNGFIVSLGLIVILQHVVIRIWNSYQKSIPLRSTASGRWAACGS